MKILGSIGIAFSMYSKIPMPRTRWTEERMEYAMCFFPLVGVTIGGLYLLLALLRELAGLSVVAWACLGAALPVAVTGGIHMDGFADTVDALSSWQPAEKKLEILKDPHTGAFAIIGVMFYMLVFTGLFAELNHKSAAVFAGVPVMSRAFSGLSVVAFPKAKKDGLAATFAGRARTGAVAVSMALFLTAAFLWFFFLSGAKEGAILFLAGTAVFFYYYHLAKKQFGGITGDIAGYFLQAEELVLLLAVVVTEKAGIL